MDTATSNSAGSSSCSCFCFFRPNPPTFSARDQSIGGKKDFVVIGIRLGRLFYFALVPVERECHASRDYEYLCTIDALGEKIIKSGSNLIH